MIKNIQYLRCVAALLVVFAHSNLQIFGVSARFTNVGGFGVDLFFVISGFIMPYILFGGLYRQGSIATNNAAGFFWRRIARIMPMYFLVTAVAVLISYLVMSGAIHNPDNDLMYTFSPSRVDWSWFVESVTFTHWERAPILGVGWSLQVEFFFYLAITFGLLLGAQKLESIEFAILGFFFVFILFGSINTTNSMIAQNFCNPLVIEFLLGLFLYRMVSNGQLMNTYAAITTIVLFLPIFMYIELKDVIRIIIPSLDRAVQWGFPALLLVWAAISLEGKVKEFKLVSLLGDASYSLYLIHAIVAPLYIFYMHKLGISLAVGPVIYLLAMLTICSAAGIAAHLYVEKPINNFVKKYTGRRRVLAEA
ncbi:acyltransferase family protein [Pseudomonas sp. NPDC096950]|uniref:acyltransferase family protein n=1 Tax=Pseudomonas sp. NPDC096950 TaxID=3364485 RepID=UPI00383A5CF1